MVLRLASKTDGFEPPAVQRHVWLAARRRGGASFQVRLVEAQVVLSASSAPPARLISDPA